LGASSEAEIRAVSVEVDGDPAVPYAYFLAAAIAQGRRKSVWVVAAILLSASTATFLVQKTWWDSDDIPSLRDAIANDQGFEGTDEYDPRGDDHYSLPEKAPRVMVLPAEVSEGSAPKAEILIDQWTGEEKNVRVTSYGPLKIGLRLLDYPAWRVQLNGKLTSPGRGETNSQMIFFSWTGNAAHHGSLCSHYGLAESSRTPPALERRRISTAAREMQGPLSDPECAQSEP